MPEILVLSARWPRWAYNFEAGHGPTEITVEDGGLAGWAEDGSRFAARLPFDVTWTGGADAASFADAADAPPTWGVLLVRKGGFAVARIEQGSVAESKVSRMTSVTSRREDFDTQGLYQG